jgi:alpha-amylase/alpha-mannosidase (GH57 family)
VRLSRFLCVHGHFYQPPRENPWTGVVEAEPSAAPFPSWNARITAECYAPNAAPRQHLGIEIDRELPSNYARMSFNFGPTLLGWLEADAPTVYRAVLEADRVSRDRFSGHGSAMAQAYSHMILPLANARDRETQVLWGIADFRRRFGREPEGMWLPEAAVDTESLETLAGNGIRFTILSPQQAAHVRRIGASDWEEIRGGRAERHPASVKLPSGRRISVFFYDGPLSQAIAFGLLGDGPARLAERFASLFSEKKGGSQLVHVATDGETYGHHYRGGEVVLAEVLDAVERAGIAQLTNYGEFLQMSPPADEIEIVERSSWSCPHGLKRWQGDCNCQTGLHPEWSQAWRAPLREALDWLSDELAARCEEHAAPILKDFWSARNDWISVLLDRRPRVLEEFLERHRSRLLSDAEREKAVVLLEIQRQAMLMFTSCGWFFDAFRDRLEAVRSNRPEHEHGRAIYDAALAPYRSHFGRSPMLLPTSR